VRDALGQINRVRSPLISSKRARARLSSLNREWDQVHRRLGNLLLCLTFGRLIIALIAGLAGRIKYRRLLHPSHVVHLIEIRLSFSIDHDFGSAIFFSQPGYVA